MMEGSHFFFFCFVGSSLLGDFNPLSSNISPILASTGSKSQTELRNTKKKKNIVSVKTKKKGFYKEVTHEKVQSWRNKWKG